jgi:hypothetical protein
VPVRRDAAGESEFEQTALLQRIEDQCGQWLAFRRDADTGSDSGSPNIRFIMTSGGQQLRLSYLNIKGRLTEIELTHARKRCTLVKYGYDNDGQLTSVTDAAGNVTRRFAYTDGLMGGHRRSRRSGLGGRLHRLGQGQEGHRARL